MTSKEIRSKFIKFFESKGHKVVPSSSLIPDDSSVLLTTAGMQQFKPYYTGEKSPYGNRVVTVQKCFRTSDIEEVGDDSHLTFFEMLGNFSFNYTSDINIRTRANDAEYKEGYFKKETIKWAYEFLTKELEISQYRMKASVFKGDDKVEFDEESYDILIALGFAEDKIIKAGREDNFWGPTGADGPCGPTVEFYIDGMEIWNLVFNEYFCQKDGSLKPFERKGVDTGMGLERLAVITQNVKNIYETDLFAPIIEMIKSQTNVQLQIKNPETYIRIIADHTRGSVFLIADGILPSNLGSGYILRRLLRRSIRYARFFELPDNWYEDVVKTVIENYQEHYLKLEKNENDILTVIQKEDEKFSKSLDKGLKELNKLERAGQFGRVESVLGQKADTFNKVDATKAFYIFQTYGFPIEMIQEELAKRCLLVDEKEFQEEFKKHQKKSRAGLEKKFGGHGLLSDTGELKAGSEEDMIKVTRLHTATHLLHQALRNILGDRVKQMGSDINIDRLRFDFSYDRKLTPEEIEKIENLVNQKIADNIKVEMREMSYEEAVKEGSLAFFKGKYPEMVKVYSIDNFSKEICGGPHIARTGELGKFRIKKEESSSAGVRRIKAVLE